MAWHAKVKFEKFCARAQSRLNDDSDKKYRVKVGAIARYYKEKKWGERVVGGANQKWYELFARGKSGYDGQNNPFASISQDNMQKLFHGTSELLKALGFHYCLHASDDELDLELAKSLDIAAFDGHAKDVFLEPLFEFRQGSAHVIPLDVLLTTEAQLEIDKDNDTISNIENIGFNQVSNQSEFELYLEVLFDRILGQIGQYSILFGLYEAQCEILVTGLEITERYGPDRCGNWVRPVARAGNWRFVGPVNQLNWLVGPAIKDAICYGRRLDSGKGSVKVIVFAHRSYFDASLSPGVRLQQSLENADRDSLINRMIAVLLTSKITIEGSRIILCEAELEW